MLFLPAGALLYVFIETFAAMLAPLFSSAQFLQRRFKMQSDKVLQETINALKQLEKRCATSAQQGDMLAGALEEVQHRMGTMQRALVPAHAQAPARAAYEDGEDVL
jgi:hypothetical protein